MGSAGRAEKARLIYLCPSSPASTAAVLVFQKGGTTDHVWFYDMEADGFSLDDKRQKATENDGTSS